MVASLRSQGSEERERLKYEHRRLEMTQLSLEKVGEMYFQSLIIEVYFTGYDRFVGA